MINLYPHKTHTPSFQAANKYILPTKEVVELAANRLSYETLTDPRKLLTIFKEIHGLNARDLKDLRNQPLTFNIYSIATGTIIRKNNRFLDRQISNISQMPLENQQLKMKSLINTIGEKITISIDDSIKAYKTVDGKTKVIKQESKR